MAKIEIEVPNDLTILTGYFVYDAVNDEGEQFHGGTEYMDFDGLKVIGLLTVARTELIGLELAEPGEED